MATTIPAASRNAAVNAVVDLLDGAASVVKIYTGTAPDPDAAVTGTLLSTITLNTPGFGAASDDTTTSTATATSLPISDTNAAATGAAGYFRAETSGGSCVMQGTCGTTGSGADMILNTATITATGTVTITAWTFTCGQTQS